MKRAHSITTGTLEMKGRTRSGYQGLAECFLRLFLLANEISLGRCSRITLRVYDELKYLVRPSASQAVVRILIGLKAQSISNLALDSYTINQVLELC